jgi:DNA invertase Pin-like site-specific DNA recombinase
MAVFGYGRVSTAEQTADNQRLEIEAAGYVVEYWYADTVSGKAHAGQRKQFSILQGKLRAIPWWFPNWTGSVEMRQTYWRP